MERIRTKLKETEEELIALRKKRNIITKEEILDNRDALNKRKKSNFANNHCCSP